MARDTRDECSRHCIFLKSSISLSSQWFACHKSLNESSVQGKYLQISRLGTADPADLGRSAPSRSKPSVQRSSSGLGLHSSVHPPASVKQCGLSTMPHLDKKHSSTRSALSWAHRPVAKWGIQMGKRETKAHGAGEPTKPSNAFRSRSWPSCTSIPGHRSANLLHNLHWFMQSLSAH